MRVGVVFRVVEVAVWVKGMGVVVLAPAGRPRGLPFGGRAVVLTNKEAREPASWRSPWGRPIILNAAPLTNGGGLGLVPGENLGDSAFIVHRGRHADPFEGGN